MKLSQAKLQQLDTGVKVYKERLIMAQHIDFKILKYIDKFEKIHHKEIIKKFPLKKYATTQRLKNLKKEGYVTEDYIERDYDNETGCLDLIESEMYSITEDGKIAFKDFFKQRLDIKINDVIRSLFFPIIVSIITSIITSFLFNSFLYLS